MPGQAPPLVREHRLYQADWLLRFYGFKVDELTTPEEKNLDLEIDPKLAWALRNRGLFPVDINRADREMLLRVPGIGEKGVRKILKARRHCVIRDEDLPRIGIVTKKARPFVITADRHPEPLSLDSPALRGKVRPKNRQLSLFDAAFGAQTARSKNHFSMGRSVEAAVLQDG